jgi:lysozyme family protein
MSFVHLTPRQTIDHLCGVEAGYVDHPSDKGKATKHGITVFTAEEHKHLWSKYNWNGDMKTLPLELAQEIYRTSWWEKLRCHEIYELSPMLAEKVLDFGVNAGRFNVGASIQKILNVLNRRGVDYPDIKVDGGIGDETMKALRAYLKRNKGQLESVDQLYMLLDGFQNYHYVDITLKREANEDFMNGWKNRTWNSLKRFAKYITIRYA